MTFQVICKHKSKEKLIGRLLFKDTQYPTKPFNSFITPLLNYSPSCGAKILSTNFTFEGSLNFKLILANSIKSSKSHSMSVDKSDYWIVQNDKSLKLIFIGRNR